MFAVSCLLIVAIACGLASLFADIAVIWLFTHYMNNQYKGDDLIYSAEKETNNRLMLKQPNSTFYQCIRMI